MKKNYLNSSKHFLQSTSTFSISVAFASALVTSANADFTAVAGCTRANCTINADETAVVKNNTTGSATLTINQGVTLTGQVENKGDLTLINSGTITTGNTQTSILSDYQTGTDIKFNITNEVDGVIIGGGGIEIGIKSTQTSGEVTIINKGTITGTGKAVADQNVDSFGISIVGGDAGSGVIRVREITNIGTIQSNEYGMNFVGNAGGRIIINKINNTGSIIADANGNDGIHLGQNTTTEVLTNTGEIKGKYGIWMANGAKIITLDNQGTLSGESRGIALAQTSSIDTFRNTGTIQGGNSGTNDAGIQIQKGAKITTLESSGIISGKEGILILGDAGGVGTLGTLRATGGNITSVVNNGMVGNIEASQNAQIGTISNAQGATLGNVIIKDSAKVSTIDNKGEIKSLATQGSGSIETLSNGSGAEIGTLSLASDIKNFTNDGIIDTVENATGNLDAFINNGNITTYINKSSIQSFNNKQNLTAFDNQGTISGELTNEGIITTLNNTGVISGGVKNTGNINVIDNTGIISTNTQGRHLENDAGKNIKITKWYVPSAQYISLSAHNDLENIGNDGDSRIVLGGDGARDVDFSSATLLIDARNYQTNVYYDVGNTILVKNSPYSSAGLRPLAIADVSGTNTFNIIYDTATGMFIIDPRSGAMAGGFFADYLVNYLQRRHISINHLIRYEEEKMRYTKEDKAHLFVIPYYAWDNFDLTSREASADIGTAGLVVGLHNFSDYGIFGGFVGYESAKGDIDIKDSNAYSRVSGDLDGFYFGLRHKAFLYQNGKNTLTLSNQAKFSHRKAKLKEYVNYDYYSDKTKVWNYALDSVLSYDYHIPTEVGERIITASAGLYYDSIRVGAFNLDTISQKRSENLLGNNFSVRYLQKVKNISGNLELGWHRLFNNEIKARYRDDEDSFRIPKDYHFLQTGLMLDVAKDAYFSLNYGALFAKNGTSHLGSLVFNLKW